MRVLLSLGMLAIAGCGGPAMPEDGGTGGDAGQDAQQASSDAARTSLVGRYIGYWEGGTCGPMNPSADCATIVTISQADQSTISVGYTGRNAAISCPLTATVSPTNPLHADIGMITCPSGGVITSGTIAINTDGNLVISYGAHVALYQSY